MTILGVTDPDNDPVRITITGIVTNDGNTAGDTAGVGTPTAFVRAEGSGRVYEIQFKAADGKGGECTGSVFVRVRRHHGGDDDDGDDDHDDDDDHDHHDHDHHDHDHHHHDHDGDRRDRD